MLATDNPNYDENPEFLEYLNTEFNAIAANSTIEELAEFAFGSMEEAVNAFLKTKREN